MVVPPNVMQNATFKNNSTPSWQASSALTSTLPTFCCYDLLQRWCIAGHQILAAALRNLSWNPFLKGNGVQSTKHLRLSCCNCPVKIPPEIFYGVQVSWPRSPLLNLLGNLLKPSLGRCLGALSCCPSLF